jgi:formate hydrogenlyase subunit 6/NADH:ubiquinone oxidoreductase subunit I
VENLLDGPITIRFPDRPSPKAGYRGLVEFDEARCEACGMCAFVCTSAAIKSKRRRDVYDWSYDPAQCTFCARCVDICEPHALSMQSICPPAYSTSGALKESHTLTRARKPAKTGASQ